MGILDRLFGRRDTAHSSHCCRYLFVLGGGSEPGPELYALSAQFTRSNPHIDFSRAEIHTGTVDRWSDRSSLGRVVVGYLMGWFLMRGLEFNDERVLYNDYYDDAAAKRYLVVAYIV